MKPSLLLCLLFFTALSASAQLFYNESQYVLTSQGKENSFLYVRWYKHRLDPSYTLKKLFLDSLATKLTSKAFYHDGVQDGPYEGYDREQVMVSGSYKNGKPDGARTLFHKGMIVHKARFILGRKAGTWEEYDLQGRLRRRTLYNDLLGTIISDIFF